MKGEVKAGRRNSARDQAAIQKAHDAIVEAGAMCGEEERQAASSKQQAAGSTQQAAGEGRKAMSLDALVMEVHEAVYELVGQAQPRPLMDAPECYVLEVYPEFVIVKVDDQAYQAAYTVTDNEVEVAPFDQWQAVERQWSPVTADGAKALTETVVAFGNEVKALGDGRVGGYLVRFSTESDPDLTGDFFTKATDFGGHDRTLALYQHGMDPALGRRVLDPAAKMRVDEVGVWVEAQLALRDDYERAVYGLAEKGKLGWSSGTAAHLVEREPVGKAMWIKRWPLGLDASLTPTPAEPRNSVVALKALAATPLRLETEARAARPQVEVVQSEEDEAMSEDQVKGLQTKMDAFEAKMEEFGGVLSKIMQYVESAPPVRNAGYISQDGGAADRNVKSFGDFLLSIYRGDVKRLTSVYGSARTAVKDLTEGTGTQGGFLVPGEYSQQLLQVSALQSQIINRVTTVPVRVESGEYPALDQYTAPTAGAGNSAFASGVTAAKTTEGGTLTETQATFKALRWRLNKVGGFTEVTNELIADSPQSIEALLTGLFRVAIAAKKEYYILRGTGNGEPLGILNASAVVAVTGGSADLFSYTDALNMRSYFKPINGQGVWIIHPSVWPDIGKFEVSTGSGGVFAATAQIQGGITNVPLLGMPILESEHLPQANNPGDVVLADLGSYLLFSRGELSIAFSEHAAFTADKGTWRFTERLDGKPWLVDKITLADPQGSYTVSPFVYHNDA